MKNILKLIRAVAFRNKPIYVHFGITSRCNLKCRMCNISLREGKELSLKEIGKAFDFLKKLGVFYVSIGGGEPLLREDLASVINLLGQKGFMVRLLTNGVLAKKNDIKNFVSAGLREVSVSLDTLNPKLQEYICNQKGVWESIIESINLFAELLPKKRNLLLINTTVSPLNIEELPELSRFAREKGCYISFIPIEDNGLDEFTFKQRHHQAIDKSYDCLIKIKEIKGNHIFNSALFLEKSRHYLKSKQRNWQCDAGKLYFSINPQGELSICHRFNSRVSLLNPEIKNFLKSKEFKSERMNLINNCPGCMRPCWAEITFFLNDKKSFLELAHLEFFARFPQLKGLFVPNAYCANNENI